MEIGKKDNKKLPPPEPALKPKKNHNGKGDAPRNLSPGFRANYEKIKWKKS
jgi:hypothetical protein